ncbi:MAG: DUF1800 domain-containing protein [Acidobacteriota bacterium]
MMKKAFTFNLMTANRRALYSMTALFLVFSMIASNIALVAADSKMKTSANKGLSEEQKIVHLLNRAGFGARPGDVERVKKMGIDKYLDLQLHPDRIDDSAINARLKPFESLDMTLAQINEKYPNPQFLLRQLGFKPGQQAANNQNPDAQADEKDRREQRQAVMKYYQENDARPQAFLLQELQGQKIIRAIYSERQLQEVLTDFWFNHFNVFWPKNGVRATATDYEMNAIRPHTLGKFKDLVLATARSSAMMQYLDNFQSSSPNMNLPTARRGQANRPGGRFQPGQMTEEQRQRLQQAQEQFARRKPGINENYARELMELHTLGVDGGYTQKDVQEVARCFTGWTIERPNAGGKKAAGEFMFRPVMHDSGEKIILGQKIAAGGGIEDGEKVIEILAKHPSTAKFISTKLAHKFVSDNPPQSLIEKVAGVYMKTDGDIREMLKTIYTSPEFYATESYRAKIKSPFELAISAIRAVGAETVNPRQVAQFVAKMGQPLYLYQPPTGYPDRAEQWVNTGALLERLNFALALSSNKIAGTNADINKVAGKADAKNEKQVLDKAIAVLLDNQVSAQTRAVLEKQLKEGVAVKGELGDEAKIPTIAGAAKADEMMNDPNANPRPRQALGGGDQVSRAERNLLGFERRMGIQSPTIAQTPVDPTFAKVFGLVLGSPEFQRR